MLELQDCYVVFLCIFLRGKLFIIRRHSGKKKAPLSLGFRVPFVVSGFLCGEWKTVSHDLSGAEKSA